MFRLGRFFGLEVKLDWTLLILVALLAVSFSASVPGIAGILAGVFFAVLLVVSVFAHEMGHVTVGRKFGVDFHSIILFIFGGAAMMTDRPRTAKGEFWMALAGPAVSFFMALLFLIAGGASVLYLGKSSLVTMVLGRAMTINLVLGVFNLLPGFPMDGGRVLRASIWHFTKDFYYATKTAGTGGVGVGYTMIGCGVLMAVGISVPFFSIGFGNGLWIGFLGWMISNMAKQEMRASGVA